ncbi:aromatic ring-hydroxylating dioxygenase subunit alpha [Streptomyces shenzhenensis]|uniref:3-phenylpropionate dioxygenase n=1 Tax=Streptomyces shenzhenensis TaxID=943815 RepID=A0A3M0I814_9ACTN|nr:aromatic ring-hydroxylating dioxygenase subunit alpha [Streptomyces shenzhenensis]RMB82339.1 3-phenylpropionate dioxygenase [Streptomyces shenzhenensis]
MTPPVNELVDADRGYINPLVFTDQGVYEQELEQVFGRSWLFLAHGSQVPKRGDFIQTYMGEDPVLVVRQKDGSVKAFLNQCRHRGMRICRSDQGTSRTFTCSYHGWAYDLEGNLVNVPQEERAYRNEIDKSKWGALKVPRIAEYKGFYFGTWSADVPEFEDYLGDMAYYFDAVFGRWDNGVELVEGTSKWVIDCNWKFASEQFASDMYHAEVSHASALIALHEDPAFWAGTSHQTLMPGRQFGGNGHGSGSFWADSIGFSESMYNSPALSEWVTANADEALRNVSEQQLLKVAGHNTIFPNFSWLAGPATMRVWHPRGPGQIEVWAWTYVPKDAPDEVKAAYRRMTQRTFSPAGSFETDDGENWTEIQQVLRGWKARNNTFNAQMGLGHDERDVHGLPGRTSDALSESAARGFYQRWSDLMAGLSWSDIAELDAARQAKEALHQEVQEA